MNHDFYHPFKFVYFLIDYDLSLASKAHEILRSVLQKKNNGCTFSTCTFYLYFPVEFFDNIFRNGKTQAIPTFASASCLIHSIKPIKYIRQILLANTIPIILDFHFIFSVPSTRIYRYFLVISAVLYSIIKNNDEDLFQ